MSAGAGADRPRVVILGGGFAGVYTALALEEALGDRDDFESGLRRTVRWYLDNPGWCEAVQRHKYGRERLGLA